MIQTVMPERIPFGHSSQPSTQGSSVSYLDFRISQEIPESGHSGHSEHAHLRARPRFKVPWSGENLDSQPRLGFRSTDPRPTKRNAHAPATPQRDKARLAWTGRRGPPKFCAPFPPELRSAGA